MSDLNQVATDDVAVRERIYQLVSSGVKSTVALSHRMGLPFKIAKAHCDTLRDQGRIEKELYCSNPGWRIRVVKGGPLTPELKALRQVLEQYGPTELDTLRERLCIASEIRFNALVQLAIRAELAERYGRAAGGRGSSRVGLRLIGDTRPRPMNLTEAVHAIYSKRFGKGDEPVSEDLVEAEA